MSLSPKITAEEFARRLKFAAEDTDRRYALFIGAGCSISSGIPGTARLVRDDWLPRLHKLRAPKVDKDTWAKTEWPDYDSNNPSSLYGRLIGELFLTPEERQIEIERLCEGKMPGYGYSVLAALMTEKKGCFNVALTTNFDDLITDALYLFANARPLVIQHESLAGFIRPTRTRPLVVKVHGDQRLTPQNTTAEVAKLKAEFERQLPTLLHNHGLIFLGYSGNDQGIIEMLKALPSNALPFGVYWVHSQEPESPMLDWLISRKAVWVDKLDFDELMLLVGSEMGLSGLDENRKRFEKFFDEHRETYRKLALNVGALPNTDLEASALKNAVERTDQTFTDWYRVELEASRLKKSDPDRADQIYRAGLAQFPNSSALMGNYALFLSDDRKNYDEAETYYRRALEADPNNANHLGNYANFLRDIRKNYDEAETYYRRALEADPNHANNLCNYAGFLLGLGRRQQGLDMLARVIDLIASSTVPSLQAECWFYAFAHRPSEERSLALRNLKQVLIDGDRSEGWNFDNNIAQAEKDGHPEIQWLRKLVQVITEGADIHILDAWPAWHAA